MVRMRLNVVRNLLLNVFKARGNRVKNQLSELTYCAIKGVRVSIDEARQDKLAIQINNTRTAAGYLGNLIGRSHHKKFAILNGKSFSPGLSLIYGANSAIAVDGIG